MRARWGYFGGEEEMQECRIGRKERNWVVSVKHRVSQEVGRVILERFGGRVGGARRAREWEPGRFGEEDECRLQRVSRRARE